MKEGMAEREEKMRELQSKVSQLESDPTYEKVSSNYLSQLLDEYYDCEERIKVQFVKCAWEKKDLEAVNVSQQVKISSFEQKLFIRDEALSMMRDSRDRFKDVVSTMTQLVDCLLLELKAMERKGEEETAKFSRLVDHKLERNVFEQVSLLQPDLDSDEVGKSNFLVDCKDRFDKCVVEEKAVEALNISQ